MSSPIMALFANMLSIKAALRVLDRFMLQGEDAILALVKQAFVE